EGGGGLGGGEGGGGSRGGFRRGCGRPGMTGSGGSGRPETGRVKGGWCERIRPTTTATVVEKTAMASAAVFRLSQWTKAIPTRAAIASRSRPVHLTQLTPELLRMIRWRRAPAAL